MTFVCLFVCWARPTFSLFLFDGWVVLLVRLMVGSSLVRLMDSWGGILIGLVQ